MKSIPAKKNHQEQKLSTNLFPVVGIGASAGGLDAFKKLLKAIPEDSGMAYVLVQHLDPNHESMLPELLQKVTRIPVSEITDKIKVVPNHIYIVPSNAILVSNDGVLELTARPAKKINERYLPIDLFFTSLAEVHQSHSIGVVLSGIASDGTGGLKAIKDHGGITFAQDEASAAYDGMPNSAVQAGVVDFILPPEKIPQKLLEVTKITAGNGTLDKNVPQQEAEVFKQILSLLRIRKGTDFTYYKQTTIGRRILRRMALNKSEDAAAYLKFLRENKQEQDVLYQDLLIPVTEFFRDKKSFDNLSEIVFTRILKNKAKSDAIRIWVAGCSTGEEAFSIAICLKEFLGDNNEKVQIFATDISEPAIAKARTGIYKKSELEGVSPERLKEFFTKNNGGYQLNKEVKNMCVFAVHNFLKDPPFGKMDLISCRNVLIYLEPYLQKKALITFHYSLNANGFLLLGKSETISHVPTLFASAVKGDKLFSRKNVPGKFIHFATQRSEESLLHNKTNPKSETIRADYQKNADDIILSKYIPAAVVVNEAFDIVHFRGKTNLFLEQSPGKPSHNLFKMAKDGLAFELRNILHKVKKEKGSVIKDNIQVHANGKQLTISIEAIPLLNTIEPHYLIVFNETSNIKAPSIGRKVSSRTKRDEKDLRIQQLEQELVRLHEDMRSITEDQEAANEELQSTNEELLSSSEELQSLNEELETSKEELQSTNEELIVVNQEMTDLNKQVTAARNYAEAIIANLRQPLLVLDDKLHIKTANSSFYKTFRLNESETEGRLIYELGDKEWNIPDLRRLLEKILPEKTKFANFDINHDFSSVGQRNLVMNGCELIEKSTSEKLILLSIEDVTEQKKIEDRLKEEQKRKTEILEQAVQERTAELKQVNQSLEEKYTELEKMNKELESFTYVSSHDLQEPLRKIQTFADRILKKENNHLSESGKEYFRLMQKAAERMQILIRDLLAFSRLSTADREFENINLNIIIEDVKKEFKEALAEKHATIKVKNTCEIKIIPFQFRQLMHNLISNALKFSNPNVPPVITIESRLEKNDKINAKKHLQKKEYCHITITDNGIGFEKEFSEKIFEVFQRLHGKEEYPGTGIGLAIVKKIVDNHNGIISATSELNKGTTFDIFIPA